MSLSSPFQFPSGSWTVSGGASQPHWKRPVTGTRDWNFLQGAVPGFQLPPYVAASRLRPCWSALPAAAAQACRRDSATELAGIEARRGTGDLNFLRASSVFHQQADPLQRPGRCRTLQLPGGRRRRAAAAPAYCQGTQGPRDSELAPDWTAPLQKSLTRLSRKE